MKSLEVNYPDNIAELRKMVKDYDPMPSYIGDIDPTEYVKLRDDWIKRNSIKYGPFPDNRKATGFYDRYIDWQKNRLKMIDQGVEINEKGMIVQVTSPENDIVDSVFKSNEDISYYTFNEILEMSNIPRKTKSIYEEVFKRSVFKSESLSEYCVLKVEAPKDSNLKRYLEELASLINAEMEKYDEIDDIDNLMNVAYTLVYDDSFIEEFLSVNKPLEQPYLKFLLVKEDKIAASKVEINKMKDFPMKVRDMFGTSNFKLVDYKASKLFNFQTDFGFQLEGDSILCINHGNTIYPIYFTNELSDLGTFNPNNNSDYGLILAYCSAILAKQPKKQSITALVVNNHGHFTLMNPDSVTISNGTVKLKDIIKNLKKELKKEIIEIKNDNTIEEF